MASFNQFPVTNFVAAIEAPPKVSDDLNQKLAHPRPGPFKTKVDINKINVFGWSHTALVDVQLLSSA